MSKISEIISKYVISLYDGQVEGVVENALFDLKTKKLKYLLVYSEATECLCALPVSAIYSIGDGAISIKNNSYLHLYESFELELCKLYNPINSNAFKVNGDDLGIITDVEIDEKFNIINISLSNNNVVQNNEIANFNKSTLLVKDKNDTINVKKFSRKTKIRPKNEDTRIVNILQIMPEQEQQTKLQSASTISAKNTTFTTLVPNRAIANYAFLINRKVKKNIISQSGNLIIKQNTKINENIINIARQNGKLKELTRYSF